MMWQRLDEDKLQDKNTGGPYAILKRVYGQHGEEWPRLVMSVFDHAIFSGVRLSISVKNNESSCWYDVGIPRELLNDAAEMLLEYAKS